MATTHSTITDPEIHEPKGYRDAEAGTVKMATGSGGNTFNRPLELIDTLDESYGRVPTPTKKQGWKTTGLSCLFVNII
jgi:hypothetical protein